MATCPTCGTMRTFVPRRGGWWCTNCLTVGDDSLQTGGDGDGDSSEDRSEAQPFQAAKLIWTLGVCGVGLAISGGLAISAMPEAAAVVVVAAALSVWFVRRRFASPKSR